MNSGHSILDRLFDGKVIVNCERQPYLLRWYLIKRSLLSLFLHKFVRSDEDRALHDHPWGFLVIPIWRGYIEHSDEPKDFNAMISPSREAHDRVPVRRRVWPIIGMRYRSALYRHRVELINGPDGQPLPAWSLFFHFKRVRDWGFWPTEGFTLWNKWWQDKCE